MSTVNDTTFVGMDVHKDSISVAMLQGGTGELATERIFNDEPSVRHLFHGFEDPGRVRACYEAGPTGYELARLVSSMGIRCQVVAPSLIPRAPGQRVKTDRRDCRRLAGLLRVGQLVAVRVPTVEEEAVRDLCRARDDQVDDLRRARQRLAGFLLRHGRVFRDGRHWTLRHHDWLRKLHFDHPAAAATFDQYLQTVHHRREMLRASEQQLAVWFAQPPFADPVLRLSCYRGISQLGALVLAAEVCDWRRFAHAGAFMGYTGLVPSEHSSGGTTRRGPITKAGSVHVRRQLIEAAWSYQHRAHVGPGLARRQQHAPPATIERSWKAQQRLCRRFRRLAARKNNRSVVATAIARELAGFVWAEMTADRP